MNKIVYVVHEDNTNGDCFDLSFTFDLEKAHKSLEYAARRGYEIDRKSPEITKYWIKGYKIEFDEIDDIENVDIDDADELYRAWSNSMCWTETCYEEQYGDEYIYDRR